MNDYYKILGVRPGTSISEIKRAYRKKAKRLHPDVSGDDATKFHLLLVAYEALIELHQNELFDIPIRASRYEKGSKSEESFSYREWLVAQNDEESFCKLIFWDLMHNRENDAVRAFKKINSEKANFSLSKWFPRDDFMDYGFILAEELTFRNEYYDAYLLLKQIITMENTSAYFKLFFPEVMSFTRDILRFKIEGTVSDELSLDAWETALDLGFENKEKAALLAKMSAAYIRIGDTETAKICLDEAKHLDAHLRVPKVLQKV